MSKSDMYHMSLIVHRETAAAWQVSEDGDTDNAVWLPKSQCDLIEKRGSHKFWEIWEIAIPEWLAEEKGLV